MKKMMNGIKKGFSKFIDGIKTRWQNADFSPKAFKTSVLKHKLSLFYLFLSLAVTLVTGIQYHRFRHTDPVFVTGPGVVDIQRLSDYYEPLEGTYGDADIYVLGTQNPDEPSILVLGGVHPNEPASQVAAVVLMENLIVEHGTVYIILETNRSAFSLSHPQEATPEWYSIETPFGERRFKYGSRGTNPVDQWPVPEVYIHQSGQTLSGVDTRNLNRAFPGTENGTYTELVAHAIAEFVRQKDIIITLDLHEASPEYAVNNALIYHEKVRATGLASRTYLNLELFWGIWDDRFAPIKLEISPRNLRGLTHRELGDYTNTLPFLAETSNASQGRIRGAMSESLIVDGYDKFYERATALGILEVDHSEAVPLDERVARHIQTFKELINAYNSLQGTWTGDLEYYSRGLFDIEYNDLNFTTVYDRGIGAFLLDPEDS